MPLFSRVEGSPDNPTLVFLHGFLGNSDDWKDTVAHLKEHYYCICIDLPGHGHSIATHPPLENGFPYCHRLIKNCLNELSIKAFSLIGYSLGGRIALDYARSQNDPNLCHLILESSHLGLLTLDDKKNRYQHDKNWAKRFATQGIQETLYEWYEQRLFDDLTTERKDFIIEERSHNYGVCLAGMLLSTSLARQEQGWDYLESNNQVAQPLPIYYCVGNDDSKFTTLANKLQPLLKANVIRFNDVGHNIHQQAPLQYAKFIKEAIHP